MLYLKWQKMLFRWPNYLNKKSMNQQNEIFPYFQPIIGVASGKIIGYEALARQYDEDKQIISAGNIFCNEDIEVEERIELDRNIRRQALERFSQLPGNSYLTLNISSAWIEYVSDMNELPTLKMIDEFGIDRSRIIIEITETEGDIDRLVKLVGIYRKNGLKVAIDDFGAGFSQLERVMAIRPDIIKIDMRLFKKAAKGGIASDVVHLLARLSKRTGCRIVCEGVETAEQFVFGLNCGAQFLQGYLFSEAKAEFLPELAFEKHLGSLRNKFLSKTLVKQQNKIKKISNIKQLILRLKDTLQDDFNLNELATWNFEATGILRFYLCNNQGVQVSPNFNFSEKKWYTDPSKIGFNWSWRSYFYNLLALEAAEEPDLHRFVTSERYKDFDTEFLCKTLSIRLDQNRVLLVDIKTD